MKSQIILLICFLLLSYNSTLSQNQIFSPTSVKSSVYHDTSIPLSEMTLIKPDSLETQLEIEEVPNINWPFMWQPGQGPVSENKLNDPVLQNHQGNWMPNSTIVNIDGVECIGGYWPPDPNGDVGVDYYFQTVNNSFAIYSKDGTIAYGPAKLKTIWEGFTNHPSDGDPIVLYDELADRWFISQFSLPNYPNGPYYELVAVSQTSDPLGAWYRYEFQFENMPDYPKFGVWPDGYYMSANSYKSGTLNYLGPITAVLERDSLLLGNNARIISFTFNTNYASMLPAEPDGPSPPEGQAGIFMSAIDGELYSGNDRLIIYELNAVWDDPEISTFSSTDVLNTASFDSDMCGFNRECIPQKDVGYKLDALSFYLMHRLQYRNFGNYQSLVANHTVDVDNTDHAGIRWYELRNEGNGWLIWQQGTFAPDELHRWVGSIAMDAIGNIALAYSVSSNTTFPSIRATGRLSTDPLGEMSFEEEAIIDGTGSQSILGGDGRWGDYSMLALDPVDDLTFWYTNEYYLTTGNFWKTRIASFAIENLPVSVNEEQILSETQLLLENYPNPFTSATTIRFKNLQNSNVKLIVLDFLGKEIATLIDAECKPGWQSVNFEAGMLPPGIYFCQLQEGNRTQIKKIVLLKP